MKNLNSAYGLLLVAYCLVSLAPVAGAKEPGNSFTFYSYPQVPWAYDEVMGTRSNPIWGGGSVKDGLFQGYGLSEPMNKYGNYGQPVGRYLEADLKIALFGSSFTNHETSNLFQEKLSKVLGKKVHVVNFSVGSNGWLSMLDIAREMAPMYQPDIILFANNVPAYFYSRLWRFLIPVGEHTWGFVQSMEPKQYFDPLVADINPGILITDRVTKEWAERMNRAKAAGDEKTIREDPVTKQLVSDFHAMRKYRDDVIATYGSPNVPNLHKDYSYLKDERFLQNMEYIKETGIPYFFIHLPTRPEYDCKDPNDFDFRLALNENADKGRRWAKELDQITGQPMIHLMKYYDPELLKSPAKLVGADGGHPGQLGIPAMADALVQVLMVRKGKDWNLKD